MQFATRVRWPLLRYVIVVAGILSVVLPASPASVSAAKCNGITQSVNCAGIPLGCPGSSKQGKVSAKSTIQCKYVPANPATWKCQAKECDFTNPAVTVENGQTYNFAVAKLQGKTNPPQPSLPSSTDQAVTSGNCTQVSSCDLVKQYIDPFITFLSALVGVAVVASITIGGIQYGSSGGDPQKVSAAKNRIRNAIIALITFVLLYALLNFLIPGGL